MFHYSIAIECDSMLVGDGLCDDVYNIEMCNFDNGDCCGDKSGIILTIACEKCICYHTGSTNAIVFKVDPVTLGILIPWDLPVPWIHENKKSMSEETT